MLDPLSALGAAASIVQFVDVASRLISAGYGAYKSTSGATDQNNYLENVTSQLQGFSRRLLVTYRDRARDATYLDDDTVAAIAMAEECRSLADQLLLILDDLKVKDDGSLRSLEAIRQAIRSTTKSKRIHELENRLGRVHGLLDSHLLKSINMSQVSIQQSLTALTQRTEAMQKENIADLRASNQAMIAALANQERELAGFRDLVSSSQVLETTAQPGIDQAIRAVYRTMDAAMKKADQVQKQLQILGSLQFPEMHMRHSAISDAHKSTLSWVYDEKTSSFKSWLESSHGLFWVNGKAGSGKSTFMKYVSDNIVDTTKKYINDGQSSAKSGKRKDIRDRKYDKHGNRVQDDKSDLDGPTAKLLRKWSGKKKLVSGSFYFWAAGFPLQKSQQGLIQSLLFQIMRMKPDSIPNATPRRWAADDLFHRQPDPWTRSELSEALATILAESKRDTCFCFFIDGLDEYSGDHYQLVEDLRLLVDSNAVKICVSSRPWNAFTSAFEELKGANATLVLQDLTRTDVQDYVRSMLEEDARFQRLAREDDRAHGLAIEIQERAQGVFLWVFLVVRSLLRGLTELDDIPELQRRLRMLPTDLEHYFSLMLNSVDEVYQQYTARTLLIVFEASQPLSMLAFWYLETDLEKPDLIFKLGVKPLPDATINNCRAVVAARLNKWCRDLLEVVWSPTTGSFGDMAELFKVDFLHRTVRDFLMSRTIQDTLMERAGPEFCASLTTCRLYLALAKWLNPVSIEDGLLPFHRIVGVIMRSAASYEFRYDKTPYQVLDELERVGGQYKPWGKPWRRDDLEGTASRSGSMDFVELARQYELKLYVRHRGFDGAQEAEAVSNAHSETLRPPTGSLRNSISSRDSSRHDFVEEASSNPPVMQSDGDGGVFIKQKPDRWYRKLTKLKPK